MWVSTPSCFQEQNRHARACKAKHSWRANFRPTSLGNVPLTNEECAIFMHTYKHQILTVNLDSCSCSLAQVPPGEPVTLKYITFSWMVRLPPPIHNAVLMSAKSTGESLRKQIFLSRNEKLGFKSIFW